MNDLNDQLKRYKVRRIANTLADGQRPCGWWKRYQRRISGAQTMSEADIQRDAARHAERLATPAGDEEL